MGSFVTTKNKGKYMLKINFNKVEIITVAKVGSANFLNFIIIIPFN